MTSTLPFRRSHAAAARTALVRLSAVAALVVGVATAGWLGPGLIAGGPSPTASSATLFRPPPPAVAGVDETSGAPVDGSVAPTAASTATAAPAAVDDQDEPTRDAPVDDATAPVAALAPAPEGPTAIHIDTVGYQAEIDRCLWVRMDLDALAPIVGAHTDCGGAVVLDLAVGDRVTLSGTGLDGEYRMTDARDAHAGDDASDALAGFGADVVLQTCYREAGGAVRLVALQLDPAGGSDG